MNKKKWHDLQTDRKFKHKLAREKHKAGQLREIISLEQKKKRVYKTTMERFKLQMEEAQKKLSEKSKEKDV